MNDLEKRSFLKQFVKSEKSICELLVYTTNKFVTKKQTLTPDNSDFIKTWEFYHKESKISGSFNTLRKYLVQLQFPVKKGISMTEDYKNATLKGHKKVREVSLELNQPDQVLFELYESSIAGKIPVIVVPNDEDFNNIICALAYKNEPKDLPSSMGALFINGINNWNRIYQLKSEWLQKHPFGSWRDRFTTHVLPNPHYFQDQIIVLSTKNYSGISSDHIGISAEAWKTASLKIRKEHECAHLFTLQYYGNMANNIHDEIVADYAGITQVLKQFNKDWFLLFMGLENDSKYRKGGRLENYQAPFKLSAEAFDGLKILVKMICKSILDFDTALGKITTEEDRINRIKSICEIDLITMASSKGYLRLMEAYLDKKEGSYYVV
jgi:hypothetical protein